MSHYHQENADYVYMKMIVSNEVPKNIMICLVGRNHSGKLHGAHGQIQYLEALKILTFTHTHSHKMTFTKIAVNYDFFRIFSEDQKHRIYASTFTMLNLIIFLNRKLCYMLTKIFTEYCKICTTNQTFGVGKIL